MERFATRPMAAADVRLAGLGSAATNPVTKEDTALTARRSARVHRERTATLSAENVSVHPDGADTTATKVSTTLKLITHELLLQLKQPMGY